MSFVRFWVVLVVACLLATGCSSDDEGFEFVAADDVGDDPFTADVAIPVPVEFVEIQGNAVDAADDAEAALGDEADPVEVRRVRLDAIISSASASGLSVIAPSSPIGIGLYGGSGVNACDIEGLFAFLEQDPGKAREWARVQGIDAGDIASFVRSLTAGFLVDDTDVVNHTFTDGAAVPFNATLEAGTAVLVDDQGMPRIRCKCGNPLQPVSVDLCDETQLFVAVIPPSGREVVASGLDPSKMYEIRAKGAVSMGRAADTGLDIGGDAGYRFDQETNGGDIRETSGGVDTGVTLNGSKPNWGSFSPDHRYMASISGESEIVFRFKDSFHGDNGLLANIQPLMVAICE